MFQSAKRFLLICVMTVLFCSAAAITVSAAAAPTCVKEHTITVYRNPIGDEVYYVPEIPTDILFIKNLASNAKITGIKSSSKYFSVTKPGFISGLAIKSNSKSFHGLKPNYKTTVSFKVTQNGKTYSLKTSVVVKLRKASPFKSLKIGTTELASKFKYYAKYNMKPLTTTKKIQITAASGYTIDYIEIFYSNGGKYKKVKNGASVSLKNATSMNILYKLKKAPANYKAPGGGGIGQLPSFLHGMASISFGNPMYMN